MGDSAMGRPPMSLKAKLALGTAIVLLLMLGCEGANQLTSGIAEKKSIVIVPTLSYTIVGLGLLFHRNGWRLFAVTILAISMVCLPILALLGERGVSLLGKQHSPSSRAGVLSFMGLFALFGCALALLLTKSVREAFSPHAEKAPEIDWSVRTHPLSSSGLQIAAR
jgi:hypothetical protein